MRVQDIMTRKPITAGPGDPIAHALELMTAGSFHHLPILSRSQHLVGIVTRRDCRIALNVADLGQMKQHHTAAARKIKLREIMSSAPIVTVTDADITEAAALMYRNHINSLPVMLEETLVGIITSSDLLVAVLQNAHAKRTRPT